MIFRITLFLAALISLTGCQNRYALVVNTIKIGPSRLASTHVGSPDPRAKNPPSGQQMLLEWWIPSSMLTEKPRIDLHLVYCDLTKETVEYSLERPFGYCTFDLLGKKCKEKGGILSYKAEIITASGRVYKSQVHQLWVDIIEE